MNRIFTWLGSWFIRQIAPPEPPEPPDVQQDRAYIPPLPAEGWAWWYVCKPGKDGTKELAAVQICKGADLKRRLAYILELRRRSRAAGYGISFVAVGPDSPYNSVNENESVNPPAV